MTKLTLSEQWVWEVAEVLYNARIKAVWGKAADSRPQFPDFNDPKVYRTYMNDENAKRADVDLALAEARAVLKEYSLERIAL